MKVRLETGDGGFVVSGTVPNFDFPYQLMCWGIRVFMLHETTTELLTYRETSMYGLVVTDPPEPTPLLPTDAP